METSGEKLASPTRYRMTGIVNLHDTRHGSEEGKDDCKNKYQNCDPEDVPLDPFTPVGQPLSEDFRLRVIVGLLLVISAPAEAGLALGIFILPPTSSFLRMFYLLDSSTNISTCLSALMSSYTKTDDVGNRGVGKFRLIRLVGLGPASM